MAAYLAEGNDILRGEVFHAQSEAPSCLFNRVSPGQLWSLHGKRMAKRKRRRRLTGNRNPCIPQCQPSRQQGRIVVHPRLPLSTPPHIETQADSRESRYGKRQRNADYAGNPIMRIMALEVVNPSHGAVRVIGLGEVDTALIYKMPCRQAGRL